MIASRTRSELFKMFGEEQLPQIKTSNSPLEISAWKNRKEVKNCYLSLFKKKNNDDNSIMLSRIIHKVFPEKEDLPNVQIAYVIAICTTMLNPKNERIQLSESEMKRKVTHYLVSFIKNLVIFILIYI